MKSLKSWLTIWRQLPIWIDNSNQKVWKNFEINALIFTDEIFLWLQLILTSKSTSNQLERINSLLANWPKRSAWRCFQCAEESNSVHFIGSGLPWRFHRLDRGLFLYPSQVIYSVSYDVRTCRQSGHLSSRLSSHYSRIYSFFARWSIVSCAYYAILLKADLL